MDRPVEDLAAGIGPLVDANVHLWDQAANPVFWLSDRTMLRHMLGDYDSLPDRYTLADYAGATQAFDVEGVVWSDPGTRHPLAAIEQVRSQDHHGVVVGVVTLADPSAAGFAQLVDEVATDPLVTSVRIRLTDGFHTSPGHDEGLGGLVERLSPLADAGLVATFETSADRLATVAEVARRLPELRVVVDHFGWPTDHSAQGRRTHLAQLASLAAHSNVATRIDAIGTIFGDWTTAQIRPWLHGAVEAFGAGRCMLGSDLPIETLRSPFERLYGAFDEIFTTCSAHERHQLFGATARAWLGSSPAG